MLYNTNPDNLISTAALTRAVRGLASGLSVTPPDDAQIAHALELACADLDSADPLIAPHTIDTRAYIGQDAPCLANCIPPTRSDVVAVYQPLQDDALAQVDQDALIPWDWCGPTSLRPRITIRASTLLALIRWPYAADALQEIGTHPPPATKPAARAYCADPFTPLIYSFTLPVIDGVVIQVGERVLIGNADNSSTNAGLFVLLHSNEHEYAFQRPADADTRDEINGAIVAVTTGTRYAGTVWQCFEDAALPGLYGVRPATGATYLTLRSNLTHDQGHACVIPRAAAYLARNVALTMSDKTQAQPLLDWATALLSRPLPAAAQALSQRIQSVTQYNHA